MKTVLITGASSGFGLLTTKTLAKNGYHVFATMRNVNGKNKNVAKELRDWATKEGCKIETIEMDVTKEESIALAINTTLKIVPAIDIVINNAGSASFGIQEAYSTKQVQALFDINVFCPYRVNREVIPHMAEKRSGLIIQLSSGLGRMVFPFMGPYCASKYAVEAMSEANSMELRPLGIETVIVEPGAFPSTSIMNNVLAPDDVKKMEKYGEFLKVGEKIGAGMGQLMQAPNPPNPQEVADAILKIVSSPVGTRPLRVVVDRFTGQGVEAINRLSAEIAQKAMG